MTDSLPKTLKVNGRVFQLKLKAATRMPDALGLCYTDKGLIEIRKGQDPHELRDTVLHELCHAILSTQGREYGAELEELYVRALATGLIGVFQDNPELASWLSTFPSK